jgi:anti-sigma B factor antagonist
MQPQLTVQVTRQPGYTTVTVAGELDIATAPELRERLVPLLADHPTLVIDLDRVSFCDATGLAVLVGAANRARANRARLHLVSSRPNIRRLFDLTGLARRLPLASTLGEALASTLGEALAAPASRRGHAQDRHRPRPPRSSSTVLPAPGSPAPPAPGHPAPTDLLRLAHLHRYAGEYLLAPAPAAPQPRLISAD